VLAQLLGRLKARDLSAAWLYISDHGQDVAHNSNFSGHNRSVRQMWEVPMLFWSSKNFPASVVPPQVLTQRPYQGDVIDHMVLGLLGARGDYYKPQDDVLSTDYDPGLFSKRHTSIRRRD
jgi:heptose-I-phosphate ethanolaminephosphotransferase